MDLSKAKITFATPRYRDVALAYPFEADGVVFSVVRIHAMTGEEVQSYLARASGMRDEESLGLEIFSAISEDRKIESSRISMGDLEKILVDDDCLAIDKEALDFLPSRLRTAIEQSLVTGEDTAPSSQAVSPPPSGNASE